jgi:hypothetical protein
MPKATPIKESDLYKNECVRLAGRITPYKLLVELNKVYRNEPDMYMDDGFAPANIVSSFHWTLAPQGSNFWMKLHNNGN